MGEKKKADRETWSPRNDVMVSSGFLFAHSSNTQSTGSQQLGNSKGHSSRPALCQGHGKEGREARLLSPPGSNIHRMWKSKQPRNANNHSQKTFQQKQFAFIPGSGRSPEEGNGNPLQYSCLGNPMDRGAWWATVHGVTKEWDTTKQLNHHHHQRTR